MQALRLIAGPKAKARIADNGLTPDLVKLVLGASGGPKWLVLHGLDRVIFGDWLPQNQKVVPLIGSSIGAWRMAVAAHPRPAEMVERFRESYFTYRYTKGESVADVTRNSYAMLERMFDQADREAVVSNAKRPIHLVAVQGRGLAGAGSGIAEVAGFLIAAGCNMISARTLSWFFNRVVFHSGEKVAFSSQWADHKRKDIPLGGDGLFDALMASGSIPGVVQAIKNNNWTPAGPYRDGGVTDYHFGQSWQTGGIVLYPHFYPYIIPGWFDKGLKGRRLDASAMDETLLLAPSAEFVEQLPMGVLPDRRLFGKIDEDSRVKMWQQVADMSYALGDEFSELATDHNKLMDRLEVQGVG